ncbi:hypothetical protein M9Y10_039807 [Tritrichomonas musculus]|uniref:Uncharacterized protein n=1 Tax=Tritrichomonas musculus TaxID=1915356 RepID=A0ABR2GR88_9EUKA
MLKSKGQTPYTQNGSPITFDIRDELERASDDSDQVEIKFTSQNIKIHFYQLCKYSLLIEKEYQRFDIEGRLSHNIKEFQKNYNIQETSLITFFNILKEGKVQIMSNQFRDLFKLSELFKVKFLQSFLERYSKEHFNDIDYIVNMILSSVSETQNDNLQCDEFSNDMERQLSSKIEKCLQNENFGDLPISVIYRVIKRSDQKRISSNDLYKFIAKSIDRRYLLFSFLNIEELSEDNFNDLCNNYIKRKGTSESCFYDCLPINLIYIKQLRDDQKIQAKIENEKLMIDIENLNSQVSKLVSENKKLSLTVSTLVNEKQKLKEQNDELTKIYKNIPPHIQAQIERSKQLAQNEKKTIELVEKEEHVDLQAIKVVLATFEKKLKQTSSSILFYIKIRHCCI